MHTELAATAARLVVEEGLAYAPAKRRALHQLGLPARSPLPDNETVEDEVRSYLALFCAETQPAELRTLRQLAWRWMQRLGHFRPHLVGAVWQGTATRLSDIDLQLFCDDPKMAEIALINQRVHYEAGSTPGPRGQPVPVLRVVERCPELNANVGVHLWLFDHDDLRGALQPDRRGRPRRGDMDAVACLLNAGGDHGD